MPPGAEVHWGEIGVDFFSFSSTPWWQMRRACQCQFDLCIRTNMGQTETSSTVDPSRVFFLFHCLCTLFFSKLSSAGLCVSVAPQPALCVCACVWKCTFVWWDVTSAFILPLDVVFHNAPPLARCGVLFHLSSSSLLPSFFFSSLPLLALTGGRKVCEGMKGTRF